MSLDEFSIPTQAPAKAVNPLDDFSAPLSSAPAKAAVGALGNPDEAGKALAIAKKTGIAPSVVQTDLPGYTAHANTQAAKVAIQNPAIDRYVQNNPAAAEVSADDWDNIQNMSEAVRHLNQDTVHGKSLLSAAGRIATEFSEGANEAAAGLTHTGVSNEFIKGMQQLGIFHDPAKGYQGLQFLNEAMILPVASGINTVMRGVAGAITGTAGSVGQTVVEAGGSQGEGQQVKREIENLAGFLMTQSPIRPYVHPARLERPLTVDEFLGRVQAHVDRENINEFMNGHAQAGPILQIEKARIAGEALDNAIEVAQESKTKQRSPELYAKAVTENDPGTVHIDGKAIAELYAKEGKAPVEGDGLLGFVPDLAAKVQAAEATGGEVSIPVADYIAHVDPTVHEGLKDVVRLHEDGVTATEAKEAREALEAFHGTPHDFESFDLTKIGTGEGAQVYGHGLYFAENKSVAIDYQNNLAALQREVEGKPFDEKNPAHRSADWMNTAGGDRTTAARIVDDEVHHAEQYNDDPALIKQMKADLDYLRSDKPIPSVREYSKGNLYKVQINANPEHMLDWDKPIKDLPEGVLQKLATAADKELSGALHTAETAKEQFELMKTLDTPTGDWLAMVGGGRHGLIWASKKAAAEALKEAGIPGIKYLDEGSRVPYRYWLGDDGRYYVGKADGGRKAEAGPFEKLSAAQRSIMALEETGTRNFVIFDDKLVKIIEKNGNPVVQAEVEAVDGELASMKLDHGPFLTMLFKDGKTIGITETELAQYSKKIANAEQNILDKSVEAARRFVARSLTPEWKRQEAAIRETVSAELATSGPFAAEKFLRENKITLGGDDVEANADALAPIFGFDNGIDLRRALTELETVQAADRKNVRQQLKEAIEIETARRMEAEHGSLAENIAKEARQIALADHTFDVLADEVRFLAKAAGVEPPLGRQELVAWAKQSFERSPITDAANYTKLSRAVAKGGREAEKALLKGDYLEAFQAKQRQMLAATVTKESLALQSLVNRVEGKIDRFTSEQTIKNLDQEHLEQIRSILDKVGVQQQHAPTMEPLPLADFVALSEGQIQAAPWLAERPPKLTEMTVEQFRDFADSIASIEHVGRQVTKVRNAQGEAELLNVVGDIVKELERFPFINQPANAKFGNRVASTWRRAVGMHLLVERVFDYTDQFNPHGPITEWLDRPLRDANTREIELTEEVTKALRDLKPYIDKSIHDKIPNTLIRDANDKTGFLNMNRMNLRVLMLNMGNWSNMRKLTEGFGVNEADLRRFVDANASSADVAWVNGIHGVFKRLKPEADAVQLRDTGVPVDHIEPVPWEVAKGKLEGGYYPLSYDLYNSDIQSRVATPLFDKGYFSATTPKGYTQERTGYTGAIDLSGNFLQSKIQGMVHDIAFREAVRNANKLIENQEFRTAVSQYWGKEVADLLPTWIRDIANSHNFDETYARDFVYAATLIRQNIINTLIGMNPGTVIKHGLTAAIMSADRVGVASLAKAVADIGASGLLRNLKGLAKREDFTPDPAFMDEFRNSLVNNTTADRSRDFVMQASAVMRNRQRQWEDSIRGALDAITRAGPGKTFADLRQLSAQYGRMAVAWGDQATAMPTWLAAYKKAYMAGESHADAVFIADKEVSRAHGSNFTGDQPSVTRLGNTGTAEFMKWFTSLYKFWNHNQNNQFQLAWDAAAAAGGRQEPGANAWSISRRVGLMMAIIAVEELAGPAKDEDGRGPIAHVVMASLRYFGGGWIGVREVTNAMANGYEPSTGLVGTVLKAGYDSLKDLQKSTGHRAGQAKDWIKHTATTAGFLTGLANAQMGRTGQFVANVATGRDRPKTFNDWRQGLRTGSSQARKHK